MNDHDETSYDKSQNATVPRVSTLGPPPKPPTVEPSAEEKRTEREYADRTEKIRRRDP